MSEKALSIQCHAQINGEDRYVSGFTAEIGIDMFWPTVQLETHPKKDAESKAVSLSSSDVTKEMGKVQNAMFKERTSPDCILTANVQGGEGGSFSFNGLLIGGSYSFQAGAISKNDAAIPDYAAVSVLNYSMYKWNGPMLDQKADEPSLETTKTFPEFIKECMKTLYESWPQCCEAKEGSIEHKVAQRQHELNGKVKQHAEKLLSESAKTFGWDEATATMADKTQGIGDNELRQRVLDILMGASGPFETVISQIAEEFQLVYVPEWKKIGKFKNRGKLMEEKDNLSLDIVSLSIQTSNGNSFFPIRYVAVCPPANPLYNAREDIANFVAAPEDGVKQGGSMLRSPGPQWISGPIIAEQVPPDGNQVPRREQVCQVSNAKEVPKAALKPEKQYGDTVYETLKTWAKNEYVYQALSGSAVRLTVPLNFNVEVGKAYSVSSKKGGQLFTGVLEHVSHTVSTGNGKSPSAYTNLTFTLVQLQGFTLPGI